MSLQALLRSSILLWREECYLLDALWCQGRRTSTRTWTTVAFFNSDLNNDATKYQNETTSNSFEELHVARIIVPELIIGCYAPILNNHFLELITPLLVDLPALVDGNRSRQRRVYINKNKVRSEQLIIGCRRRPLLGIIIVILFCWDYDDEGNDGLHSISYLVWTPQQWLKDDHWPL